MMNNMSTLVILNSCCLALSLLWLVQHRALVVGRVEIYGWLRLYWYQYKVASRSRILHGL